MSEFRLFFATDIHGSDVCWKKFINAAKFFDCQVLLMGGDMTGKMLVPIVDLGGGRHRARLAGDERIVGTDEVPRLRKLIPGFGLLPLRDQPRRDRQPAGGPWRRRAALPGEDDRDAPALDRDRGRTPRRDPRPGLPGAGQRRPAIRRRGPRARRPGGQPGGSRDRAAGRLVDGLLRLVEPDALGLSAEEPEEHLLERIEVEVGRLASLEHAVFNLHVPPKDSQLDKAAVLNPDLSPVMSGGAPVLAGVGSTAVRTAIERHQPPLALHGHIHELRGTAKIGRTLSINPGSEYNDGILRGVIVTLSDKGMKRHQLLAG